MVVVVNPEIGGFAARFQRLNEEIYFSEIKASIDEQFRVFAVVSEFLNLWKLFALSFDGNFEDVLGSWA